MSSIIVCLGYTGSIIGLIQSFFWIILSVCGILIRYDAWVPEIGLQSYSGVLSKSIVVAYLQVNESVPVLFEDVIVTPDVLSYWMFLYLVTSTAWFLLSTWQFVALTRQKKNFQKIVFPIWAGCTCFISLLDLTLTILLGIDYNYIIKSANAFQHFYSISATIVVMAIAARGYVLWIVNVIVALALAILHHKRKNESSDILRQHILAYENESTSRQGKDNYGFNWDHEKSTENLESFENRYYTPSLPRVTIPPTQTTNSQLVKNNRLSGRTTPTKFTTPQLPNSFMHPRVPSPDYSPVHERKNGYGNSALKIRTQKLYGTQF